LTGNWLGLVGFGWEYGLIKMDKKKEENKTVAVTGE